MKDNHYTSRLILNKVSHSYSGSPVLKNLSVVFNPGEFVALVGPSGCGKTTLLNLLSGYIMPVSRKVVREGIIRTIYQHDGLFPWLIVSENISMGLRPALTLSQRQQQLDELIVLIQLKGFEKHYPHQLSGGMRQRVELARALAGDSDILLMDEPFSSLDYQTRILMRRELVCLLEKRRKTVVFVTHDIEEAVLLADRILVLKDRPAYICLDLLINAPHPRALTDVTMIEAVKRILNELQPPDTGNHLNAAELQQSEFQQQFDVVMQLRV